MSRSSTSTGGRSSSILTRTLSGSRLVRNTAIAAFTKSATLVRARCTSNTPASIRVMSSRFDTSRVRRSDSISIRACNSCASSSESWRARFTNVDEATLIVARGVRRSCDTAPIRAWRRRSTSSRSVDRTACSRSWARSIAIAASLAKVTSMSRSSSLKRAPRRTSTPTGRPAAAKDTVRRSLDDPSAVDMLTERPGWGSS